MQILGFIIVFAMWFFASKFNWLGNTLIASPGEVMESIKNSFKTGSSISDKVYLHAFSTIKLCLSGWGYAVICGTFLALLFGNIKCLKNIFNPIIEINRAIPPILAFPVFLVAFNFNTDSYVWTIFFGTLPVMYVSVASGFNYIRWDSLKILKLHEVKLYKQYLCMLMEIFPSFISGARLSFSLALIISVVTEMVFTPRSGFGIGSLARDAEMSFNTPLFYHSVLFIALIGFSFNQLLLKIEKYVK